MENKKIYDILYIFKISITSSALLMIIFAYLFISYDFFCEIILNIKLNVEKFDENEISLILGSFLSLINFFKITLSVLIFLFLSFFCFYFYLNKIDEKYVKICYYAFFKFGIYITLGLIIFILFIVFTILMNLNEDYIGVILALILPIYFILCVKLSIKNLLVGTKNGNI